MEVLRYDDPLAFRRDAAPMLLADTGRNNLPLWLLQVLVDEPQVYPVFHLWLAADDGRPLGLAMQTEPHNVVLADPLDRAAVVALADAVAADGAPLPGVTANLPWADHFAERVTALTGRRTELLLGQGVWELTAVADVPQSSGAPRAATPEDRDLLVRWFREFEEEALPAGFPRDDDVRTEQQIDLWVAGSSGGLWLWEDGGPVSLSGHRVMPGVGSRIGPVYTPPDRRGRGYATALVAALSAARLSADEGPCFLFTDLANPTSNAIYSRIGYVKLCDAAAYLFFPEA